MSTTGNPERRSVQYAEEQQEEQEEQGEQQENAPGAIKSRRYRGIQKESRLRRLKK